jgi:tetratricopeptide (TPR) repeat protein
VTRSLEAVRAPRHDPTAALEQLRQRVVGALAVALDRRLRKVAGGDRTPPLYAAYQEYVAGFDAYYTPDRAPDYPRALEHFLRAAALDTAYVRARLLAAQVHRLLGRPAAADSILRLLRARGATLDPWERAYADRLEALLRGDRAAALVASRRLVALSPSPVTYVARAADAVFTGRLREAIASIDTLEAMGDVAESVLASAGVLYQRTIAFHVVGDYERELRAADAAVRRSPDRLGLRVLRIPPLAALGRLDELREELAREASLPEDPTLAVYSGALNFAAMELQAHGHPVPARDYAVRASDRCVQEPIPETLGSLAIRFECVNAFIAAGRWGEANAFAESLARSYPDSVRFVSAVGQVAAARGDRATAERIAAELARVSEGPDLGLRLVARARLEVMLGRPAAAVRLLGEAAVRSVPLAYDIHADPVLVRLRGTPAFDRLTRPSD